MIDERNKYLQRKREIVLEEIKPICNAFEIKDFDYVIDDGEEKLKLENTMIMCSCNSVSAVIDEVIGYILIMIYCKNRHIGAFSKQTQNVIKQNWLCEVIEDE